MRYRPVILALAGSLALVAATGLAAEPGGGKTYRWKDKDGVTHIGDSIPPEYASQAHEELNNRGVPVRSQPRELTPEEAAAEQKRAAEEARRRQWDSYLLTTYTKVADIEMLRDERVAQIDGQIELARSSIAATDQRLATLRQRLDNFKPYSAKPNARRVPDQLAEEVVRALSERRLMQGRLDTRVRDRAEQVASFESDIARYRELTTRPASR